MRNCTTTTEHGFTLVGVTLMLFIMSIVMLGFFTVYQVSADGVTERGPVLSSIFLALDRIEEITWDATLVDYANINTTNYPASETMSAPFTGLTRTTTITEVSHTDPDTTQANSGLKRIDVEVSWGNANNQSVTLHGFVAEYN